MTVNEVPAERLHPLSLASGFLGALRNLFGSFLAGGYVAAQGQWRIGLAIVGGVIFLTLVTRLLHWWRFTFQVGEDAIRIDSGIVSRKHRTIPYDRLQDVGVAQGPLQRLFGLAEVKLDTGSGGASEEGVLEGIRLHRAEELRLFVRARRAGVADLDPAGQQPPESDGKPLFALDRRRLFTLGLFNFSLAIFAGLFGVSQTLGDLVDVDPFERSFWRRVLDSGAGDFVLQHRSAVILGGLLVLALAGLLTGLVRTVLAEWDFILTRSGNGFRRRRGLLTRSDVTMRLRRIQAAVITSGPVRERFGWSALRAESMGDAAESGSGDRTLAPLATDAELTPILDELGWQLPSANMDWQRVDKAMIWSFVVLLLPIFPLLLIVGPTRYLNWRRTRWALAGEFLYLKTGWFWRRTLILPLRNIQTIKLVQSSYMRRFGIASLFLGVGGGSLLGYEIHSLPTKEASQLRRKLLSFQP